MSKPTNIPIPPHIRKFVEAKLQRLQAAQEGYSEAVGLMIEQAAHDGGITVEQLEAGYVCTDLAVGFAPRPTEQSEVGE